MRKRKINFLEFSISYLLFNRINFCRLDSCGSTRCTLNAVVKSNFVICFVIIIMMMYDHHWPRVLSLQSGPGVRVGDYLLIAGSSSLVLLRRFSFHLVWSVHPPKKYVIRLIMNQPKRRRSFFLLSGQHCCVLAVKCHTQPATIVDTSVPPPRQWESEIQKQRDH